MNNTLPLREISLLIKISQPTHIITKRISKTLAVLLYFSFDGCISGIMHSNGVRPLREAQLQNTSGTSQGCLDPCSQTDKCENGGICRDGVSDVWCDCNGTRFEGTNCTEGRNQSFTYDERKIFEQNQRSH